MPHIRDSALRETQCCESATLITMRSPNRTPAQKEQKERKTMKTKKSFAQKVLEALTGTRIPATIIELILKIGKNNLIAIVHGEDKAALTAIPGIAEKRADIIIASLKKALMNGRLSNKVDVREKALAFTLRTFPVQELFRNNWDEIKDIASFYPDKDDPTKTCEYTEKLAALMDSLLVKEPFTVRRSEGRITRLCRSILSDVMHIDYNSQKPCSELVVAEHKLQQVMDFHWSLFAATEEEGKARKDEFLRNMYIRLGMYGMKVVSKVDQKLYGGIASSASHQKSEKLLMGEFSVLKAHSDFLWMGRPMQSFVEDVNMTGAEFWKMRANIIRPILRCYKDENGKDLTVDDVLVVPDVKKTYHFDNARRFGKNNGALVKQGADDEDVIVGDGAALGTENAQGGWLGGKIMMIDRKSAIEAVAKKYDITVEEVLDKKVKGIDKKMHRFGDHKVIVGEGCWKFDKAFDSYDAYITWMNAMNKKYPGINRLFVLRQSEEVNGENKIRRLTRTLIQQWMMMTPAEQRKLTAKARKGLKKDKTFRGALSKLAALYKNPEDRTELERLYYAAPWLLLNPNIQLFLKDRWTRRLIEAASGKFRTEGQYPYIMQDPVALLEIWVMGKDANDPDIGILKGDEISVADVPDGKELCCVRFPANFLTAKVMKNKACVKEFASCGNIAIISVHSDILIRQDGDVDGDEMCILYNRLAIEMTKRMNTMFNPPVILFAHGSKAERKPFGSRADYIRETYTALWRAKKFDNVGINANLATACAYLASDAYTHGDMKACMKYLLWMSVASTSAILAIDQVKGNQVDEDLIRWVEQIKKDVRKAIQKIAVRLGVSKDDVFMVKYPFVHFYVAQAKRDDRIFASACAPLNNDNLCDSLAGLILHDAGNWEFDAEGAVWNKEAANAILNSSVKTTNVRNGVVTQELIEELGNNWFRRALNSEDRKVLEQFRVGGEVSLKDVLMLLHRNEMSMSYSMEGTNLAEKKAEYWCTVKDIMYKLSDSKEWVASEYAKDAEQGYVYTSEEKHASVANAFLKDALELGKKGNGVADKAGYVTFVLNVFAKEALTNVLTNKVDVSRFFGIGCSMDDLEMDTVLDTLSDDEELFEAAPLPEDAPAMTSEEEIPMPEYEAPAYTDEELAAMCPSAEECDYGFCF